MLHVLRGALADLGQPEGTTAATLAHQVLRQGCTNWTPFNDVRLLQGVAMHGYRWATGEPLLVATAPLWALVFPRNLQFADWALARPCTLTAAACPGLASYRSAPDILADASLGLQAPLADELNTAGLPGTSGAGAAAADGTEQQVSTHCFG